MDKYSREGLREELAKQESYTRNIHVRLVDGKVEGMGGELFVQEEVELYRDGNPVTLKLVATKMCSNNHVLVHDNAPVALCAICEAVLCSQADCAMSCARCGRTVCRRHAHVFKSGQVVCKRCKPREILRRLFW